MFQQAIDNNRFIFPKNNCFIPNLECRASKFALGIFGTQMVETLQDCNGHFISIDRRTRPAFLDRYGTPEPSTSMHSPESTSLDLPPKQAPPTRPPRLLWLAALVSFVAVALFPLSNRLTRASGLGLFLVVWIGLIALCWHRRALPASHFSVPPCWVVAFLSCQHTSSNR